MQAVDMGAEEVYPGHGHKPSDEVPFDDKPVASAPSASDYPAVPCLTPTTLPATHPATFSPTTTPPMAQGLGFTGMPYPTYGALQLRLCHLWQLQAENQWQRCVQYLRPHAPSDPPRIPAPPTSPQTRLKKTSKPASAKAQSATRRAPKSPKRPSSRASAPRPPPPSAIPRPPQHSRPREPQKRNRSSQTHQTTIVWAPPKRAKTTPPLPPPHSKARYRQTRLPLPSRPTATRRPGQSAPAPPPFQRLPGHPKFFPPIQRLSVPSSRHFSPLPLPEPRPPPPRVTQHSSNLTIRATVYIS